jgi:hypothetical protein
MVIFLDTQTYIPKPYFFDQFNKLFFYAHKVFPYHSHFMSYCQMLCMKFFDQAATSLMPSVNFTPFMTSVSSELPLSTRHRNWAD